MKANANVAGAVNASREAEAAKTARLRELRLAKEAAEKEAAAREAAAAAAAGKARTRRNQRAARTSPAIS